MQQQRILEEIHRRGRRGHRVLNRTDPVSLENVRPGNAWYLQTNVQDNKIHHVYHKNTIDKIFQTVPQGKPAMGPTTRKPFQAHHVKKLTHPSTVYTRPASKVRAHTQFEDIVRQHLQEMHGILRSHYRRPWNHECDRAFKDIVIMAHHPFSGGAVVVAGDAGVNVEVAMFHVDDHRYHIYFADSDGQNEMYMYDVDENHFENGLHRVFQTMTGTPTPYLIVNADRLVQNPSSLGNRLGMRITHVTIDERGMMTPIR